MRKQLMTLAIVVIAFSAVPGLTGKAEAVLFSDTIDFVGQSAPFYGYTYTFVNDNVAFSWTHDVLDNLGGNALNQVNFQNAVLSVTFANTSFLPFESWSLSGFGTLLDAELSAPVTQLFNLSLGQLGDLAADGLFTLVPFETTGGFDRFRLIEATLSGNFTTRNGGTNPAIPEPASLLLLASGMGLAGLFSRKKI